MYVRNNDHDYADNEFRFFRNPLNNFNIDPIVKGRYVQWSTMSPWIPVQIFEGDSLESAFKALKEWGEFAPIISPLRVSQEEGILQSLEHQRQGRALLEQKREEDQLRRARADDQARNQARKTARLLKTGDAKPVRDDGDEDRPRNRRTPYGNRGRFANS